MASEMLSIEPTVDDLRTRTVRDFEEKNQRMISSTIAEMGRMYALRTYCLLKGYDFTSGHNIELLSLLLNSEDISVSAFHMAKQRAAIETGALLRIALESATTSLHIARDAKAMAAYLERRYKSTASISFAKKHIPVVPQLWGALSNAAVHTNPITFGPERHLSSPDEITRTVTVNYDIRPGNQQSDSLLLHMVSLVSLVAYKVFEIVFCRPASINGCDGLAIPSIDLFITGKTTDELIQDYFAKITELEGASDVATLANRETASAR